MKPTERILIYGCLAVLVTSHLVNILGSTTRVAQAETLEWLSELGPAETIRITRKDGSDLVLRNTDGRLSWGEEGTHRAHATGLVYIGAVLRQLMDSEVFVEERENLNAELREREEAILAERQTLEERYAEITPDDPGIEDARREFNQLRAEYEQFREAANARVAQLTADQLEQAYRELVAAVNIVADEKGVDIVNRFIPTDDPFEAANADQALAAIRLRSLLRYPKSIDLTADVLDELALEAE